MIEKEFEFNGERMVKLGVAQDELLQTIANFRDLKNILITKIPKEDRAELAHDFDVADKAMMMIAVAFEEVSENDS